MEHRLVDVRGGRISLVEEGEGPLVVLVHGFPEGWYAWRHQLPALAAAGFRAAAIDVRGYGGSLRPPDTGAYGMLAHVADTVGVVRALGARTAAVVGHDWGSPIAATTALLRPDVVTAVGLLGVPYTPPGGPRPTTVLTAAEGQEESYVGYFQHPGRAEREAEADVRGWLAGVYAALSADADGNAGPGLPPVAPGGTLRERLPAAAPLPAWLGEDDLAAAARAFERTGFGGALARYRNLDRDWADLAAWEGLPLRQPSLYVTGEHDPSTTWLAAAIEAHPRTLPGLAGQHVLPGVGHWVQQEAPEAVNGLLTGWLTGLSA